MTLSVPHRDDAADTPGVRPTVLLLSSNVRRRYAEDILSTLALPRGAAIQFRYEADYVAGGLLQAVANGSAVGRRCLVAFMADVETPQETPFVVPVRFAAVVAADCVADMVVFRLRAGDFANLEEFPLAQTEIRARGRWFVDKLTEAHNGRFYPATARFPDLHVHERQGDEAYLWLEVARRLARHPTFRSSYFVRTEEPLLNDRFRAPLDAAGRLRLSDGDSVKLRVGFYSDSYSDTVRRLACATAGTFLTVSSDASYEVAHRYDTVEFWLRPEILGFDALTRVTITLAADGREDQERPGDSLTTSAGFPVVVRRSRPRLLLRVSASSAGAFLVALPAVLGPSFPLHWRVLCAVTGAALLAVATIVISHPK
ncbi:hypothetical protein MPTA5024_02495 [Microbispora sp. ATCC PTA-5024]|nr:hypothetical protein MPTA5024_02495 [Microbispora sp. ATCC PTA-5024]